MAGQGELIHEQKGIHSFLTYVAIENLAKETYHTPCLEFHFQKGVKCPNHFFKIYFSGLYIFDNISYSLSNRSTFSSSQSTPRSR